MNERTLFLAILASVVVVSAGFGVYAATWTPNLAVTEGSVTGVIEGNLTSINSTNPLFLDFNATTYGNQSGYPASTLVIRTHTTVFWQVLSATDHYDGYVSTRYDVAVLGRFASDLHPSTLLLRGNDTAGDLDAFNLEDGYQTGTNVSFNPNELFGFFGTGSDTIPVTLENAGGAGPYYDFEYHATFLVFTRLGGEPFVGFRASVDGLPSAMSVGILLRIIDVPGGT